MAMKIFYIADTELPSEKANAVNTVKMCEAFASAGHSVTLYAPMISGKSVTVDYILDFYAVKTPFQINRVKLPSIPGVLLWFAFVVVSSFLMKRFSDRKTIFVYGRSPFALAALSCLGFRVGIDVHGQIWNNGFTRKLAFKVLLLSKSTCVVTFNTPELLAVFKTQFKVNIKPHLKLAAMPNGSTVVKAIMPFLFQGSGERLKVGYLGSFLEGRGIEMILQLATATPEMEFHLAGGESTNIPHLKTNHLLPDNLYFYGHIPFKETYAFREGCDVLIAPYQANVKVPSGENTLNYMSPIKLFEYMSSQRPIICSDFPVIRGVLSDENSILVKSDSVSEWQNALQRLTNATERKIKADHAFQKFQTHYTWEIRAKKVLTLIQQ